MAPFDFKKINGLYYGVIKTPFESYIDAKDIINKQDKSSTITS